MIKIIILVGIVYVIYSIYKTVKVRKKDDEKYKRLFLDPVVNRIQEKRDTIDSIVSEVAVASRAKVDSVKVTMGVYLYLDKSYMIRLTVYFQSKKLVEFHRELMQRFQTDIQNGKVPPNGELNKKMLSELFSTEDMPYNYPTFTEFKAGEDYVYAVFYKGKSKDNNRENLEYFCDIIQSAIGQTQNQYPNVIVIKE